MGKLIFCTGFRNRYVGRLVACLTNAISRLHLLFSVRFLQKVTQNGILLAEKYTRSGPRTINGGDGHVVQINESVVSRTTREWAERCLRGGSSNIKFKKGFPVHVTERKAETLLPIIQRRIRPGTATHSVMRKAYQRDNFWPSNVTGNPGVHEARARILLEQIDRIGTYT